MPQPGGPSTAIESSIAVFLEVCCLRSRTLNFRQRMDIEAQTILAPLQRLGFTNVEALEQLQVQSWHGDRFFRLDCVGQRYLVRLIDQERVYRASPLQHLSDSLLSAQLRALSEFRRHGLPYMELIHSAEAPGGWSHLIIAGRAMRMVLFKWAQGRVLERVGGLQAAQIGYWLGWSHKLAEGFLSVDGGTLALAHDYELHGQWREDALQLLSAEPQAMRIFSAYLQETQEKIAFLRQQLRSPRLLVHADFNLSNVRWSPTGANVSTILDFDQLGWSRAVEDLAWVVKWYALRSEESQLLDNLAALLEHYQAHRSVSRDEWQCLPALLWLNSGLNYNFVLKIADCLQAFDGAERVERLRQIEHYYGSRSERMHEFGFQLVRRVTGQ